MTEKTRDIVAGLSDEEIKEALILKGSDFQPGIHELYLLEAAKRGMSVDAVIVQNELEQQCRSAPLWKRALNCLMDAFAIYGIGYFVVFGLVREAGLNHAWALLGWVIVYFLYYIIFEYRFGRTLGKWITKTVVVSIDGRNPTLGQIIGRTFSRFVPLDAWVALFTGTSMHENFTRTRTVEDTAVDRQGVR